MARTRPRAAAPRPRARMQGITAAHRAEVAAGGMIIQSLLDTDLYKFTMMQVVLHHFPGAQVEYKPSAPRAWTCGRPGRDRARAQRPVQAALPRSRARLPARPALHEVRLRRFPRPVPVQREVRAHRPRRGAGEIDITIRGPWLHTILYEIPVLAIVSEVYFRRTQPRPNLDEAPAGCRRRSTWCARSSRSSTSRFPTTARAGASRSPGRRRCCRRSSARSRRLRRHLQRLVRHAQHLTPLGTMAHEYMQACQALGPRLRDSQTFAFDKWAQEYRGDLGIAIADTYGWTPSCATSTCTSASCSTGRATTRAIPSSGAKMIAHYRATASTPHQDADLLRPARSARHRDRAPLPRPRAHRVRHRHQPHQRPRLRADQHRAQDDRVQRPAGGQGVRRARQDDQQGRGLPCLPAAGIRPRAGRKSLKRTALAVLAACFALNMFGRGMGDTYAVFLLPLEREFSGRARRSPASIRSTCW